MIAETAPPLAASEEPLAGHPPVAEEQAGSLPDQAERVLAVERIRASQMLPPALRDCLARVVETSGEATTGGTTRVLVEDLVRAVEEAVPDFLKVDARRFAAPEHPAGDVFFHGDPSVLSDQQAEEIAKQQLARSGLLRGQKVRVAE